MTSQETTTMMLVAGTFGDILFYVLPLLGSMLLVFGIYQVVRETRGTEQKRLFQRLSAHGSSLTKDKIEQSRLLRKQRESKSGPWKLIASIKFVERLQRNLDQANLEWSASRMLANCVCVGVAGGLGLAALGYSRGLAVGFLVAALMLPIMYVRFKRKRRIKRLINQLPDVFELMSQALRAGHSLASSIQLISEQMPDPIGTEFARVYHEQNLGLRIEDALLDMANRLDELDIRFFVTAVLIQRQTGGDLAEVLDNIGSVIRDRIQLLGVVRALTAEGRLSGWVLLALPFLVFLATMQLNPEYTGKMLVHPTGKMMLVAAGVMQILGLLMIKKIVNIKV